MTEQGSQRTLKESTGRLFATPTGAARGYRPRPMPSLPERGGASLKEIDLVRTQCTIGQMKELMESSGRDGLAILHKDYHGQEGLCKYLRTSPVNGRLL